MSSAEVEMAKARGTNRSRPNRETRLQVLATADQAQELRRAAEREGISLSSWLLRVALHAAREQGAS